MKLFAPQKHIVLIVIAIVVVAATVPESYGLQGNTYGERLEPAILSIKPVQVVWNSDINGDGIQELIDGKSTAVLVYVNPVALKGLDDDMVVKTRVLYAGAPYYNNTAKVGDILKLRYIAFRLRPTPFTGAGRKKVTAILDYDKKVPGMSKYNTKKTIVVNVMKTKRIKVLFVPVNGTSTGKGYSYLNAKKYNRLCNQSARFLRAMYPIAESDFIFDKHVMYIRGSPNLKKIGDSNETYGKKSDYDTLYKIADTYGYDRVVGVVPAGYFKYHYGKDALVMAQNRGVDHCSKDNKCKAIIMSEDAVPQMIAHELGHSFGLNMPPPHGPGEEYSHEKHYPGNNGSGFYVGSMRPIKGLCFMGWNDKRARYWVCDETWKQLFLRLKT